jgi:hypothetical protein
VDLCTEHTIILHAEQAVALHGQKLACDSLVLMAIAENIFSLKLEKHFA